VPYAAGVVKISKKVFSLSLYTRIKLYLRRKYPEEAQSGTTPLWLYGREFEHSKVDRGGIKGGKQGLGPTKYFIFFLISVWGWCDIFYFK